MAIGENVRKSPTGKNYKYLNGATVDTSVRYANLRLAPEDDVKVGEKFIMHDPLKDRLFFVEVLDVVDGQESSDRNFGARIARHKYQQFRREEAGEDLAVDEDSPYDDPILRGVYDLAKCKILGYYDSKESMFSKPDTKPVRFLPVRQVEADDFEFLKPFQGDLRFGKLRSGPKVLDFELGLRLKDLVLPTLVLGPTGSGKSTLIQNMLSSVAEVGASSVIAFDRHKEMWRNPDGYKALADHPDRENFVLFSNDAQETDARKRGIKISVYDLDYEDILNNWTWDSQAQVDALLAAMTSFGNDWIVKLAELPVDGVTDEDDEAKTKGRKKLGNLRGPVGSDSEEDVGFGNREAEKEPGTLADILPNFDKTTLRVLHRRMKSLIDKPWISKSRGESVAKEILELSDQPGKVIVIDLASLRSRADGNMMINIISNKAMQHHEDEYYKPAKVNRFKKLPPLQLVVEEGNAFVASRKASSANIMDRLAYEGRKYKINYVLACQSLKGLTDSMISQTPVRFIGGVIDPSDRSKVMEGASQDISDQETAIQAARTHQWILTAPDRPFAFSLQVETMDQRLSRFGDGSARSFGSVYGGADADAVSDSLLSPTRRGSPIAEEDRGDDELAN